MAPCLWLDARVGLPPAVIEATTMTNPLQAVTDLQTWCGDYEVNTWFVGMVAHLRHGLVRAGD